VLFWLCTALVAATVAATVAAPVAAQVAAQVVEDFDPAQGQWRFFTDQVMGGQSDGRAVITDGALHLTGQVSTANNGGFIQARRDLPQGLPQATTALNLRVRGDGQRYFVHLRSTATRLPWHYYQAEFQTTRDWQDVTLPLADFVPSGALLARTIAPERLRSIAIVAFGRDHSADVRVMRITAQ